MNTCDCTDPPGGTASCEDDQLAVCVVEDGEAHTFCITLPRDELVAATAIRDAKRFLVAMFSRQVRTRVISRLFAYVQHGLVPALRKATIANFVLSIIKAEPREPLQGIGPEDAELLSRGELRHGKRVIRFRVPPERGFTADLPAESDSDDPIARDEELADARQPAQRYS